MILTLVSLFPVFISSSIPPSEFCPQFSNTDCGNCILNVQANYSCGYCADTKSCIPGDADGPFVGGCESWHITNDDFCKADSSLAYSTTTRIVIGVIVGIITVVTVIYWVFVFPRVFKEESL